MTRRVEHFEITGEMGRGGMGIVYRARDTRLGREVALKVLPPDQRDDSVARERQLREARSAAALSHPNIATIYDIGESEHGTYIAMELVEGESLDIIIEDSDVDAPTRIRWAVQLCDALAAAHARGIIHRDLKAANVMVTRDDEVKVLDFGLATGGAEIFGDGGDGPRLTQEGIVVGTVDYLAPELLKGGDATPASDVFSLGVVLFELFTNDVPFKGRTPVMVMNAILNEPTPSPNLCEGMAPGFASVLMESLEKDPAKRIADAGILAERLRALGGGSGTSAKDHPTVAVAQVSHVHNLPASVTSFIGREEELEELERVLGGARLITITGAGGSGKTRIALELAHRRLADFANGVFLVEFSAVSDEQQIAATVGRTICVREEPGRGIVDVLVDALAGKEILLIFDNCEHVIGGIAELARELLQRTQAVHILTTSRERLDIAGEHVWQNPPLSLPEPNSPDAAQSSAVRLFADRAAASKPGFTVTPEALPTIVKVCRRLDGIPLAIELAAARLRVLSPEQLLERLEDRFRILTSRSRSSMPRQQTLLATVEWSVDLLTEQERSLFYRLSVFSGSMSLEAIERVCADEELDALDVLDDLERLVDKSLLVAPEETNGESRYRLLETLKDYGAAKLAEAGDADVRRRHADYFAALAVRAESELTGPDQATWFNALDRDAANLRSAVLHLVDTGRTDDALRAVGAVSRHFLVRGYLTEGRRVIERVLEAAGEGGSEAFAAAHQGAGTLANDQGDYAAAKSHFETALRVRRELADKHGEAATLNSLAIAARDQGDYGTARTRLKEGLALARDLGDAAGEAASIHALGITAHREGDCDEARRLFEEALAIRRALGDRRGIAGLIAHLGSVAYDLDELDSAESQLLDALGMFEELGNKRGLVWAKLHIGGLAQKRGDFSAARRELTECVRICKETGDKHFLARSFECLASLASATGSHEAALQLESSATTLRDRIGSPRTPMESATLEKEIAASRQALSGTARERAEETGRSGPLDVAIAFALAER